MKKIIFSIAVLICATMMVNASGQKNLQLMKDEVDQKQTSQNLQQQQAPSTLSCLGLANLNMAKLDTFLAKITEKDIKAWPEELSAVLTTLGGKKGGFSFSGIQVNLWKRYVGQIVNYEKNVIKPKTLILKDPSFWEEAFFPQDGQLDAAIENLVKEIENQGKELKCDHVQHVQILVNKIQGKNMYPFEKPQLAKLDMTEDQANIYLKQQVAVHLVFQTFFGDALDKMRGGYNWWRPLIPFEKLKDIKMCELLWTQMRESGFIETEFKTISESRYNPAQILNALVKKSNLQKKTLVVGCGNMPLIYNNIVSLMRSLPFNDPISTYSDMLFGSGQACAHTGFVVGIDPRERPDVFADAFDAKFWAQVQDGLFDEIYLAGAVPSSPSTTMSSDQLTIYQQQQKQELIKILQTKLKKDGRFIDGHPESH